MTLLRQTLEAERAAGKCAPPPPGATTPHTDAQLLAAGRAYLAAACNGTASEAVAAMRAALAAAATPARGEGHG